jgi:hypothetical protein
VITVVAAPGRLCGLGAAEALVTGAAGELLAVVVVRAVAEGPDASLATAKTNAARMITARAPAMRSAGGLRYQGAGAGCADGPL